MLGGLVLVVITVMFAGLLRGIIAAAILGGLLLLIISKDRHGRSLLSRGFARLAWWSPRSRGAHLYRSGSLGRALWGTHQLPGLAASSRLSEHTDSYGRPFALVQIPATGTFTVVIGPEPYQPRLPPVPLMPKPSSSRRTLNPH